MLAEIRLALRQERPKRVRTETVTVQGQADRDVAGKLQTTSGAGSPLAVLVYRLQTDVRQGVAYLFLEVFQAPEGISQESVRKPSEVFYPGDLPVPIPHCKQWE